MKVMFPASIDDPLHVAKIEFSLLRFKSVPADRYGSGIRSQRPQALKRPFRIPLICLSVFRADGISGRIVHLPSDRKERLPLYGKVFMFFHIPFSCLFSKSPFWFITPTCSLTD